jgi:TP901 family phage tail tape measure protein
MLNAGMGFVFTARDLASSTIARLERTFASLDERVGLGTQRITRSFRGLGIGMGLMTAGLVGLGAGFALANVAGKFEEAIAQVGAISTASAEELKMFHDAAIEAGLATQFSPTEATMGLRELAQSGLTARESTALLIPVLDLAAASLGELTPQGAAGVATQMMKVFGIAVDQAAFSMDQMVKSANLFSLNAGDLPIALGTAARGAQLLHQSLSETLITVGLVKNAIPGIERASTAASVAMERMADSKVQMALKDLHVEVKDSSDRFRSFLDIVGDLAPQLEKMSDVKRAGFLLNTFGREALGGISATMAQLAHGVTDASGKLYQGAAAVAYLRDQMAKAGGTMAAFRDKMLATFEGQKKLLRGSMETLGIVLGEAFAEVFRPVVHAVVEGVNAIIRVVRGMPAPLKKALALLMVGISTFVALTGAVVAAKAGLALLSMGLGAVGVSLGGIVAALAPAILVIGLVAAAAYGLYVAFQKNLGGIGDFARTMWERVSLFFRGLAQLIQQGGFSDAVREELLKVENQGLKQFLITVYAVAYRIQRIWEGFREGFTTAIEAAAPVFRELVAAFTDLGDQVSALFSGWGDAAASLPSSQFKSFGESVGSAFATIVSWAGVVIGWTARLAAGIVAGFRSMKQYIQPAIDAVSVALDRLSAAWDQLMGATGEASASATKAGSAWRVLGQFLGVVFGTALEATLYVLALVIRVVEAAVQVIGALKDAFVTAGTWIGETAAGIYIWFSETLPNAISSSVEGIIGFFNRIGKFLTGVGRWFTGLFDSIASGIKSFLQPVVDFFKGVGRAIKAVFDAIRDMVIEILREIPDELLPSSLENLARSPLSTEVRAADQFDATARTQTTAGRAEAASSSMPAAVDTRARADDFAQFESNMKAYANDRAQLQGKAQPFNINLQVDGETLARVQSNAETDLATRSFSPVPAY